MRLRAAADAGDGADGGVDHVGEIVETAGIPELRAVRADIAHVGAAAAGDQPGALEPVGRKIEDADAARPVMAAPLHAARAAIGDVEFRAVAADDEAVRADAGVEKARGDEARAVDGEH